MLLTLVRHLHWTNRRVREAVAWLSKKAIQTDRCLSTCFTSALTRPHRRSELVQLIERHDRSHEDVGTLTYLAEGRCL